ncbi:MAG: STAS domain-containing protein, partial [Pseudomonadales bacterium]|nr:STAS domain-containing protein [Pseudomonadales bacterium]
MLDSEVHYRYGDNDDCLVIEIKANFNFETAVPFKNTYERNSAKEYLIDLENCPNIDSTGIGLLLTMRNYLGDATPISIVNCNPQV